MHHGNKPLLKAEERELSCDIPRSSAMKGVGSLISPWASRQDSAPYKCLLPVSTAVVLPFPALYRTVPGLGCHVILLPELQALASDFPNHSARTLLLFSCYLSTVVEYPLTSGQRPGLSPVLRRFLSLLYLRTFQQWIMQVTNFCHSSLCTACGVLVPFHPITLCSTFREDKST